MVALLRHFLAGSLLLLAVFTPTVEAVKCARGGVCYSRNGFIDKLGKSWKAVYTPIVCPDKCYQFMCKRNGAVQSGIGCEDSLRKVCPQASDYVVNTLKRERKDVTEDDYYFTECLYKDCSNISDEIVTSDPRVNLLFQMAKMDPSCTYVDDESNAGNLHGNSSVLLGWIFAGWIFAANLW